MTVTPTPRRENTADRRRAIAEAARALIVEKGVEGLRTRDIAERVGINVATLHYHVPTKEALIGLVADTMREEFRNQSLLRPRLHLTPAERLEHEFGARHALPLYCAVDPELHGATREPPRWDLGYLGTWSADRQPALETLLLEPARLLPDRRFVVAGSQYPETIAWPANVERISHVPPQDHPSFYSRQRYTLNVTRSDMVAAGWSPSVRMVMRSIMIWTASVASTMAKSAAPRSHMGRTTTISISMPIAAVITIASAAATKMGSPRRVRSAWQTMPPSITNTPCAKFTMPLAL